MVGVCARRTLLRVAFVRCGAISVNMTWAYPHRRAVPSAVVKVPCSRQGTMNEVRPSQRKKAEINMFAVIYSRVTLCRSSSFRRLRCSFENPAFDLGRLDLYLTSGAVALAPRLEDRIQPPSSSPERFFPLHHCHSSCTVHLHDGCGVI